MAPVPWRRAFRRQPGTPRRQSAPAQRRWATVWIALTACALLVVGSLAVTHRLLGPEGTTLTVATGQAGGVYHSLGEALEEATSDAQVQLVSEASPASVANLELIATGAADVGFSLSDVADLAVTGQDPFTEQLPVRAIGRVYDNHTHLVVRADSSIQDLQDLHGATVSLGSAGSGTELMSHRLLQAAQVDAESDLTTESLDLLDAVEALEDHSIDAFFWSGALPTAAVTDLANRTPIRLVDLSEWVPALTEAHGAHYSDVPVPHDSYPGQPGVRTIGVSSLLLVRADLPDDTVEALTEQLFELKSDLLRTHPAIRQLSARNAVSTHPVPLHPGAVEYYHRVKVGF